MYRRLFATLILLALLTFAGGTISPVSAQTEEDQSESPRRSGEAAFAHYCAPCHGTDGRGDGPKAFGLSRPPPDLTTLADRNGGIFPHKRLARIVDGREQVNAHTREMPLWGEWFKLEAEEGFEGEAQDETKIRKRIDDLLDFLESMQR